MKILPDGYHIRTLVFKLFLYYMPQLVLDGKIFVAVPPLYGLKNKKNEIVKYFTTKLDYTEFLMKTFNKDNQVADLKKNLLSSKDMCQIIYNNTEYTYILDVLKRRYAINPKFLEYIVISLVQAGLTSDTKSIFKVLKKNIEKEYRFMKVTIEKDVIVMDGIIEFKSNSVLLTHQFYNDIVELIKHVASNYQMDFLLNGEKCRLYEVMKAYEGSSPGGIIRYKGLGEMNENQLAESTLRPDSDRVLIQYNLDDAKDAIAQINYLESDKKRLLVGTSASRSDLVG